MTMTILIAPSGFKESLAAHEVADCIAKGARDVLPHARIIKAPLADGGEGFAAALVDAAGGHLRATWVTGPVGEPVRACFGLLPDGKTAVLEMAAAAGLRLVPKDRRDPTATTSRGVGELIGAALDAGARRILLGCGDSGVNDGGAGMAQALGVRLLDAAGQEIGAGGGELARLHRIDLSGLDKRLAETELDAAVNWHNVLLGSRGVTRVFGPQKGATPKQVEHLDGCMENWAGCIRAATGLDLGHAPGSGASGGLGAGFAGLLGGTLHPRFEIVMQYLELDRHLDCADLVITAEGSLDAQSPYGKVPGEVGRRAKARGLPVIALAGSLGSGAASNLDHGIDAFSSILRRPCNLEEAMAQAGSLLTRATANALRMVCVGMRLSGSLTQAPCRPYSLAETAHTFSSAHRTAGGTRPSMPGLS